MDLDWFDIITPIIALVNAGVTLFTAYITMKRADEIHEDIDNIKIDINSLSSSTRRDVWSTSTEHGSINSDDEHKFEWGPIIRLDQT
jgi:hypothetical protein